MNCRVVGPQLPLCMLPIKIVCHNYNKILYALCLDCSLGGITVHVANQNEAEEERLFGKINVHYA